jgi:phosphohistidine phosphatase SixA
MKLTFLRHGIATPKRPENSDLDDFRRELTPEGITETRAVALQRDLFRGVHTIFTSPLCRAVQTAEIVYESCPSGRLELLPELDKLLPASHAVEFIYGLPTSEHFCFVGHEPQLGKIVSRLLIKKDSGLVELKKSGIVVLEGKDATQLLATLLLSPRELGGS